MGQSYEIIVSEGEKKPHCNRKSEWNPFSLQKGEHKA